MISAKTGHVFHWGSCLLLIRLLTLIAALPLRIWVLIQRVRGKISAEVARNRLGHPTAPKPQKPVVWIHAASLGELSAVRPFLRHYSQARPDHALLMTTNNPAALTIAAGWQDVPATLQAAPLDIPNVVERFLDHWQPIAFANVETEVWPNRFNALAQRGVTCIGLNARMSETSAKRFAKLGPSVGLHHFSAIYAQNEQSAANFRKILGPQSLIEVIPNFKSMVTLPDPDPALVTTFDRSKTILAASTHPGEDAMILAAFTELTAQDPDLKLILAPRHPNRAANIAQRVRDMGQVSAPLGSQTEAPIFIVETLGQLPQLYALAAVTFIGGSLVPDIGGHTPYEPIRAGSAIVTGEMTANFTAEFTALNASQGCIITAPPTLTNALTRALKSSETLAANACKALPPVADPTPILNKIAAQLGRGL